jgi:hypothetical protein
MSRTDDKFLARPQARYHLASKTERTAFLHESVKTPGTFENTLGPYSAVDENEGKIPSGAPER